MFDRIFVPLEGSSDSESVLTWLRSWDLADVKLTLFHCLPSAPNKGEIAEPSRFGSCDEAREYLEAVSRTLSGSAEVLVRSGSAGERIVTAALQAETGLVVLGVPGDYGSPRTLGKAAATVVKTCPQPVVVVKTPVRSTRRRVRRILAPLDASSRGDENMDVLRDVARDLRAEIILLHVGSGEGDGSARESTYSDVQLNLIRQVWSFLKEGIAARTIMTKGSIVEEILTHEQSLDVDLVAIPKENRPGTLDWAPVVDRCERAVLLYEPREAAPAYLPRTTRVTAVRI